MTMTNTMKRDNKNYTDIYKQCIWSIFDIIEVETVMKVKEDSDDRDMNKKRTLATVAAATINSLLPNEELFIDMYNEYAYAVESLERTVPHTEGGKKKIRDIDYSDEKIAKYVTQIQMDVLTIYVYLKFAINVDSPEAIAFKMLDNSKVGTCFTVDARDKIKDDLRSMFALL